MVFESRVAWFTTEIVDSPTDSPPVGLLFLARNRLLSRSTKFFGMRQNAIALKFALTLALNDMARYHAPTSCLLSKALELVPPTACYRRLR